MGPDGKGLTTEPVDPGVIELEEPYQPRRIEPGERWRPAGWQIKTYTIAYEGEAVDPDLIEAARSVAQGVLPAPAVTEDRYGTGFTGVHEGRGGNLAFLGWWVHENELVYHAWTSGVLDLTDLEPVEAGEAIACAWDLRVIAHERTAWVEHVLAGGDGPDLDGYLADTLDGWH